MATRNEELVIYGKTAYDGAGVRLKRIFSRDEAERFDPFLLLDAFGSDDPSEYLPGFPMHPHRGIETVTYLLKGTVRHADSLGNAGTIGPGDLQWMSAGSGIIHEEMPQESQSGVLGLQLWVNLAAANKMRPPAYRDVSANSVPSITVEGGTVKVLAGTWGAGQVRGPVEDVAGDPVYLDIHLQPSACISIDVPAGRTVLSYIIEGSLYSGQAPESQSKLRAAGACILYGQGNQLTLCAGPEGARFIIAHAPPLKESIAWGGPIVMNTRAELETAFRELDEGTFIKH